MASYSHTTWAQLKSQLLYRLGDTTGVYWTDAECGLYLTEALRVWGLLTAYWTDTGFVNTSASIAFYDITSIQNQNSEALLSYTVTDSDVVKLIQYHLQEPPTGNSWTGSEQFTLQDVTTAIQTRRDQFLSDTSCVITRTTGLSTAVVPDDTLVLPDTTLQLHRLAWADPSGVITPVQPTDISHQRNYDSSMLFTPGPIPLTWSSASSKLLTLLVAPPVSNVGTFEMLCTKSGSSLNPTVGIILGIPDDLTWVIKWGALADLLGRDGPARDIPRAYFCERRYQLGVELARRSAIVVNVAINNVSTNTEAVEDLDAYNSTWQTDIGVPVFVGTINNLIALSPCPDDVYNIQLDVVRKAIIPATDAAFVQIGREYLDVLVGYAEHLAAFKEGGQEMASTMRTAQNFFDAALSYNEKLASQNPSADALLRQSTQDFVNHPVRQPGGLGALQQGIGGKRIQQALSGDSAASIQSASQ